LGRARRSAGRRDIPERALALIELGATGRGRYNGCLTEGGAMERVTGLGGVFLKADDPERMYGWYEKHLGLAREEGVVLFHWRQAADPEKPGMTVWSLFPRDSKYFDPSRASFMINFRVADLDGLLAALRAEGVTVDKREDSEYGRFAWIIDPEGNRVELWEPPAGM
jgi:catechol 2,3-dioxygenase-like lactoylglutathione lyase family enzyme